MGFLDDVIRELDFADIEARIYKHMTGINPDWDIPPATIDMRRNSSGVWEMKKEKRNASTMFTSGADYASGRDRTVGTYYIIDECGPGPTAEQRQALSSRVRARRNEGKGVSLGPTITGRTLHRKHRK